MNESLTALRYVINHNILPYDYYNLLVVSALAVCRE